MKKFTKERPSSFFVTKRAKAQTKGRILDLTKYPFLKIGQWFCHFGGGWELLWRHSSVFGSKPETNSWNWKTNCTFYSSQFCLSVAILNGENSKIKIKIHLPLPLLVLCLVYNLYRWNQEPTVQGLIFLYLVICFRCQILNHIFSISIIWQTTKRGGIKSSCD
jgi:hypothetical protein